MLLNIRIIQPKTQIVPLDRRMGTPEFQSPDVQIWTNFQVQFFDFFLLSFLWSASENREVGRSFLAGEKK